MITLILIAAFAFTDADWDQYTIELSDHIDHWLRNVPEKQREQRSDVAHRMIPHIIEYCEWYGVDPLRIAVLAQEENSWKAKPWGKAKEIGPLQVVPKWFKGFELDTLKGQLHAGIWWLSEGIRKCGEGAGAYHYYKFAVCPKLVPYPGARRRERLYKNAVKKYRGRDRTK
jgi:hypothetical protein